MASSFDYVVAAAPPEYLDLIKEGALAAADPLNLLSAMLERLEGQLAQNQASMESSLKNVAVDIEAIALIAIGTKVDRLTKDRANHEGSLISLGGKIDNLESTIEILQGRVKPSGHKLIKSFWPGILAGYGAVALLLSIVFYYQFQKPIGFPDTLKQLIQANGGDIPRACNQTTTLNKNKKLLANGKRAKRVCLIAVE